MKIVSWNCNMAFRKKINVIIDDTVDVLILQECEEISKLNIETWAISPTSVYWYGKNSNKGLAVFTFNEFKIDCTEVQHNESFVYVIPLIIYKNQFRFLFLLYGHRIHTMVIIHVKFTMLLVITEHV